MASTTTSILSGNSVYASTGTESSTTDRLASDKNTFLKLLVAQLTHQDPLNPTDDKEFVAQLAQFTSLEQLQEINAGVGTLNDTMHQGQLMSATGFIGKDVVVTGAQITKGTSNGQIATTASYFTINEDMAEGYYIIRDGNGNLVYQEELPARNAGIYTVPWTGRNLSGSESAAGVYQVSVVALDKNGNSILVNQQMTATVYSVFVEDGVYMLGLDSGRSVALTDVTEVSDMASLVTTPTTYESLAADEAASTELALKNAATYLEKTLDATTATDAEKWANEAIKAAKSARTAATSTQKVATNALSAAESSTTSSTWSDYNKAQAIADQAAENATAAEAAAAEAQDWAETTWGVSFS